jgi:hypothetical protein
MAFVPELLLDHHLEAIRWFHETRKGGNALLHEDNSWKENTKMKNYDHSQDN